MKDLKVLKILTKFNQYELQKFRKFLDSPYLCSDRVLVPFFDLMVKDQNKLSFTDKERLDIWKKVYPSTSFSDAKWRKLCNDLIVTIEQFYTLEELSNQPLFAQNLLMAYINKTAQKELFNSTIQKIKHQFSIHKNNSSNYHLSLFEFERQFYNYMDFEVNMEKPSNLSALHKELDLFFLSEKIKQLVTVQSRLGFINREIETDLGPELLHIIESKGYLKYNEIHVYYTIYKLKEGTIKYETIKNELLDNISKISYQDAIDIIKEIINFCTLQYNQGLTNFAIESLGWYKFGLSKDFIFPGDKFNPGDFLNIVLFGIRTKEFTWTERFIEEYQKIIPKESKRDIVTFSLARLFFNQQKFTIVIEKLRDVEFKELTYNLDAKVLLLATYYEAEEWPAMSSLADAFRTFLSRHEKDITPSKKQRYANFIKYIKKLSKVKYQDKKAKLKLLEELQTTTGIVNQGWLIEKAKIN